MTKDELKKIKEKGSINDTIKPLKEDVFFDNLITIHQLSRAFGVAPKTLKKWVALRQIPFVKVGRKTLFRQKSLETWLQRKEKSCR